MKEKEKEKEKEDEEESSCVQSGFTSGGIKGEKRGRQM